MKRTSIPSVSRVDAAGTPVDRATGLMILIHGRGGSSRDILTLSTALPLDGFAYLAPQAEQMSWYPYGFLAPIDANEPGITNGLSAIDSLVSFALESGLESTNIVLAGFSQGACLVSEYAARNARRYGCILVFSGGLIGPLETERDYRGSFDGTPILIGCNEADPHIPKARVMETASIFTQMDANVEAVLYPADVPLPERHTIVPDEVARAQRLLARLVETTKSDVGEDPAPDFD